MRKFIILLCGLLFTAQFAVAQKNLYVISKTGELTYCPATKVFFGNDLFTFTYGTVTNLTKKSFVASFAVVLKSSEVKSFNQALEVGICFSDSDTTPTIKDGKIIVGTSLGDYSSCISGLDVGTTCYYRAYVNVNDAVYYGEVQSQTTYGENKYTIINGHRFVDLGLPSGLLWAETNIGAETAADDGDYYAWGETTEKEDYDWDTYKYGTSSSGLTKYNKTDGKTVLDKEDDAAYVNWGDSCRMPTKDEFEELRNIVNCTWTWTSETNSSNETINGYEVTSWKTGNSIFLPASGLRNNGDLYKHGSYGYYWSSMLRSDFTSKARLFSFYSDHTISLNFVRYEGYTVRPVAAP